MEIRQLEPKDKIITFFGEIKSSTVESVVKDIMKINLSDLDYIEKCRQWAIENRQEPAPVILSPIKRIFYQSPSIILAMTLSIT